MWEAKVIAAAAAAAAAAETNWKHKVTPDWGDLITIILDGGIKYKDLVINDDQRRILQNRWRWYEDVSIEAVIIAIGKALHGHLQIPLDYYTLYIKGLWVTQYLFTEWLYHIGIANRCLSRHQISPWIPKCQRNDSERYARY